MARIGDFEIVASLGQGALATVYRARHDGEEVALKVLRDKWVRDPVVVQRFRNEAEAMRRCDHPNIVRLLAAGEDGGTPYIALEYVDGPTLAKAIRKHAFTHRESAAIMMLIARAMAHAHERGVIHADITPGNILLASDGVPKLSDFGLAHCRDLPPPALPPGATAGTPVYMSPEQARGDGLDPRSDVYALGAVLYEAATHRAPFKGSSTIDILKKVERLEPPPPREMDPAVDPVLECCILRAMAKERDRRYSTALELAQDLERWIRSVPDWYSILPFS